MDGGEGNTVDQSDNICLVHPLMTVTPRLLELVERMNQSYLTRERLNKARLAAQVTKD